MNKELLIVFVKNPDPGNVKTRIARETSDLVAVGIYQVLLEKTRDVVQNLNLTKRISYCHSIRENDQWDPEVFQKTLQKGVNLGEKMFRDFETGFDDGYEKIVLLGSDIYDLEKSDIETAFEMLDKTDCVLGPAEDGGYYLIGFNRKVENRIECFRRISWSTSEVLDQTIERLKDQKISFSLIKQHRDIDTIEDVPSEIWDRVNSFEVKN